MKDQPKDGLGERFSDVLARARKGDSEALGVIYSRYSDSLRVRVRRRLPAALRSKYDTMDLVQSVFAQVIRGLPALDDRGERAFVSLLTHRAENKIRDKLRRHLGRGGVRAELRLETDDGRLARGGGAEPALDSAEEDAKARRHVVELDATSQRILHLHLEGRTFAQIAAEVALSSGDAARKRHERALASLRRRWDAQPASGAPASGAREPT